MKTLLSILSILSIVLLLVCTPAFAQSKKDLVDTGEGLTFQKPEGWVVATKKEGTAAALYAAGDKQSQIEFRFAEVQKSKSKQYFNAFHGSLVKMGLEKLGPKKGETYGKLAGKLTRYRSSGKSPMQIYVFEFVAPRGAWLVVGMFDEEQAENYFTDYEKLLGVVVLK